RRAGTPVRRLADLRALPAVQRVPAVRRVERDRLATDLDPRTGPGSMGPAAAVTDRVIVVGYGPVGATAALLLARWGVPVLVLEARPSWTPIGSRSICQQRDVLDVWDSVGAGAIATEGRTWTTARTYWRDRELTAWRFVDRGRSPLPPFVNISQSRTEQ